MSRRSGARSNAKVGGLKVRPHAIVNYDNFSMRPEMLDAYSEMVMKLVNDVTTG